MAKKSRDKGKAYENFVAKIFRLAGWPNAKRHLEFQSEEAVEGRDLDGTQPFAVQAKCWKKAPPITALLQVNPTEEYPIPVAVLKRTRAPGVPTMEVAVVDLDVFMRMVAILRDEGLLDLLMPDFDL